MCFKTKTVIAACVSAALAVILIISACMPVHIVVETPVNVARSALPQGSADVFQNAAADPAAAQPVARPETTPPTEMPAAQGEPSAQAGEAAAPADGAMSKEQVVELYNTAVNKVKQEAASLTRNYKHVSAPEDQLELPGAIQGLGKTASAPLSRGRTRRNHGPAKRICRSCSPWATRITPLISRRIWWKRRPARIPVTAIKSP